MIILNNASLKKHSELFSFLNANKETVLCDFPKKAVMRAYELKQEQMLDGHKSLKKITIQPLEICALLGLEKPLDYLLINYPASVVGSNALLMAAENGHLEIVKRLLKVEIIRVNRNAIYNVLLFIAIHDWLELFNEVIEYPIIHDSLGVKIECLQTASGAGKLVIVNKLLEFSEVNKNAAFDNNAALKQAGINGHINIFNQLILLPNVIASLDDKILSDIIIKCPLAILDRLLEFSIVRKNITAHDNMALRRAVAFNTIDIIERLLDFPDVVEKLTINNNEVFRTATERGDISIVEHLLKFPEVDAMIKNSATNDYVESQEQSDVAGELHRESTFAGVPKHEDSFFFKKIIEGFHRQNVSTIACKQCGGEMYKSTHSTGNFIGIVLALITFFAGILIIFFTFITIIGPIIGLLMILVSLGMGGKSHKVWKCKNCGYYFNKI